jgi:hypothetical protein
VFRVFFHRHDALYRSKRLSLHTIAINLVIRPLARRKEGYKLIKLVLVKYWNQIEIILEAVTYFEDGLLDKYDI